MDDPHILAALQFPAPSLPHLNLWQNCTGLCQTCGVTDCDLQRRYQWDTNQFEVLVLITTRAWTCTLAIHLGHPINMHPSLNMSQASWMSPPSAARSPSSHATSEAPDVFSVAAIIAGTNSGGVPSASELGTGDMALPTTPNM